MRVFSIKFLSARHSAFPLNVGYFRLGLEPDVADKRKLEKLQELG